MIARPLRLWCKCCTWASNRMRCRESWERIRLRMTVFRNGNEQVFSNRHDVKLLSASPESLVIIRPELTHEQPQQLCLDAAYYSTPVYKELLARHYQPHVRSRGEDKREIEFIPGLPR